jgi:hypothetical protein
MIKLFPKFFVTSLIVLVFVFGMNTNVLGLMIPINMYISYPGNVASASFSDIETYISDCCGITEESWSTDNFIELPKEIDSNTLEIADSGALIAFKAGTGSWLICNPYGGSTITIESPNGRGISNYASVPDASIMWLLGTAFIILGLFGRRRAKA